MSTVMQPKPEARLPAGRVQPTVSAIRRKPQFTYISPSSSEVRGPLHLLASSSKATTTISRTSSASTQPKLPTLTAGKSFSSASTKHTMGPPLPLYHPFGKLAMSLPPLDPSTFGLPLPISIDDDSSRSSTHSKRSGVKLRDAAVETDPIPPVASVSAVAAIAAREIKSPRKKRTGGGVKRKRNDADTAYPAKRNRQTRGAIGTPNDDEPDSPGTNTGQALDVASTPGTPAEVLDKPERRTTRSRGAMVRRDSTASETPSVSAASINVGKDPMTGDNARDIPGVDKKEKRRSTSKEEGEVSEESKSV